MQLTFKKGPAKTDHMIVERAGKTETIECPKQRIVPHDMVHFCVESVLQKRGFLGRVREGEQASFRMESEAESDGVERLVEVIQGDAWSGGTTPALEMLDLYQVTCVERSCPALAINEADLQAIRARMAELDVQWQALPVGGSMTLAM
jgi:hypothetical protein